VTGLRSSLSVLEHEIATTKGWLEHAVFGSTALVLRNIISRTPDDIDVMVTRRVWGELLAREWVGWRVETPNAGDPPILTLDTTHPLHLFFDWRDDAVDINPVTLLLTAESGGYGPHMSLRLAAVEEILRQKEAAYACLETHPSVAKHAPDIEACKQWLGKSPDS
jgi:hypothetical protein